MRWISSVVTSNTQYVSALSILLFSSVSATSEPNFLFFFIFRRRNYLIVRRFGQRLALRIGQRDSRLRRIERVLARHDWVEHGIRYVVLKMIRERSPYNQIVDQMSLHSVCWFGIIHCLITKQLKVVTFI